MAELGGGPPVDLTPENANFVPCAEKTETATLVPVSLFFAVDKSGSVRFRADRAADRSLKPASSAPPANNTPRRPSRIMDVPAEEML